MLPAEGCLGVLAIRHKLQLLFRGWSGPLRLRRRSADQGRLAGTRRIGGGFSERPLWSGLRHDLLRGWARRVWTSSTCRRGSREVQGAREVYSTSAADLLGIARHSSSSCVSVGKDLSGAVVVVITNRVPTATKTVSGSTVLDGVACRTCTFDCLAGGDNGSNEGVVAWIYNETPVGTSLMVKGTDGLNGVACTTNTSCLVVGINGSDEGVLAMVHLPPR